MLAFKLQGILCRRCNHPHKGVAAIVILMRSHKKLLSEPLQKPLSKPLQNRKTHKKKAQSEPLKIENKKHYPKHLNHYYRHPEIFGFCFLSFCGQGNRSCGSQPAALVGLLARPACLLRSARKMPLAKRKQHFVLLFFSSMLFFSLVCFVVYLVCFWHFFGDVLLVCVCVCFFFFCVVVFGWWCVVYSICFEAKKCKRHVFARRFEV